MLMNTLCTSVCGEGIIASSEGVKAITRIMDFQLFPVTVTAAATKMKQNEILILILI